MADTASLEIKAGNLRLDISSLNRKLDKPGTQRAKEILRKKRKAKQIALAKVEEKISSIQNANCKVQNSNFKEA